MPPCKSTNKSKKTWSQPLSNHITPSTCVMCRRLSAESAWWLKKKSVLQIRWFVFGLMKPRESSATAWLMTMTACGWWMPARKQLELLSVQLSTSFSNILIWIKMEKSKILMNGVVLRLEILWPILVFKIAPTKSLMIKLSWWQRQTKLWISTIWWLTNRWTWCCSVLQSSICSESAGSWSSQEVMHCLSVSEVQVANLLQDFLPRLPTSRFIKSKSRRTIRCHSSVKTLSNWWSAAVELQARWHRSSSQTTPSKKKPSSKTSTTSSTLERSQIFSHPTRRQRFKTLSENWPKSRTDAQKEHPHSFSLTLLSAASKTCTSYCASHRLVARSETESEASPHWSTAQP